MALCSAPLLRLDGGGTAPSVEGSKRDIVAVGKFALRQAQGFADRFDIRH